jgi:glycosyltransferase involved in cell wall biosynthesis
MTRKRLLAISHDFSASGAPIALFNVLEGLKDDYDVLVAAGGDGPLRQDYLSSGILAVVIPNLLTDENINGNLLLSFDAVLANTLLSCMSIRAASHLKKPSVWYVHEGHFGLQFVQRHPPTLAALPLATCVVYPAKFTHDLYYPWRRDRRFELIPYGVPNRDGSAPPIGGPIKVLQLGSFESRKGQDIALAALSQLNDPGFHLDFVGRVLDAEYYQQVLAYFADVRNFRHQNEVPKDATAAYLRACDILIVPSRDEVTPMVILEAMAAGKPVIASRICGIPEMIVHGETGLLFDSENAGQLAQQLRQLGRDPELRRRLGENGRRFQREERTLEHCRDKFRKLFATLLPPT